MGEIVSLLDEGADIEITENIEAIAIDDCKHWLRNEEEQDRISSLSFAVDEFLAIANFDMDINDTLLIGMSIVEVNIDDWSVDTKKEILSVLASKVGLNATFAEKDSTNG